MNFGEAKGNAEISFVLPTLDNSIQGKRWKSVPSISLITNLRNKCYFAGALKTVMNVPPRFNEIRDIIVFHECIPKCLFVPLQIK